MLLLLLRCLLIKQQFGSIPSGVWRYFCQLIFFNVSFQPTITSCRCGTICSTGVVKIFQPLYLQDWLTSVNMHDANCNANRYTRSSFSLRLVWKLHTWVWPWLWMRTAHLLEMMVMPSRATASWYRGAKTLNMEIQADRQMYSSCSHVLIEMLFTPLSSWC